MQGSEGSMPGSLYVEYGEYTGELLFICLLVAVCGWNLAYIN